MCTADAAKQLPVSVHCLILAKDCRDNISSCGNEMKSREKIACCDLCTLVPLVFMKHGQTETSAVSRKTAPHTPRAPRPVCRSSVLMKHRTALHYTHVDTVACASCGGWVHWQCVPMNPQQFQQFSRPEINFRCRRCAVDETATFDYGASLHMYVQL